MLQNAVQLLALLSAGAFVLSVIFQWGYFTPLDLHLLAFLTLQDYFVGAILFLPPVTCGAFLGLVIGASITRGIPPTPAKRSVTTIYLWGVITAVLAFLFIPFVFLFAYTLPFMFFYFPVARYVAVHLGYREFVRRGPAQFVASISLLVGPVVAASVFLLGMSLAFQEINLEPQFELSLGPDVNSESKQVKMFRSIDRGVLYALPNENRLFLLSEDHQISFSVEIRPPYRSSWSCLVFSWPCLGKRL